MESRLGNNQYSLVTPLVLHCACCETEFRVLPGKFKQRARITPALCCSKRCARRYHHRTRAGTPSRSGTHTVTDGPFAETKELIIGGGMPVAVGAR